MSDSKRVIRTYTIKGTEIGYNGSKYRSACQMVWEARKEVESLPESLQERVLGICEKIAQGVVDASREIYLPLVNPDKIAIVESGRNDYNTDMKGLEGLVARFKKR
jgi:hypothetical protein